LKYTSNKKFTF